MICLAVSIGTAKPMPTLPWLPLPPVAIWELMPITLPVASMSGPPELPGLIGASVCSTSSISKLLGAWIVRWTAEMTPVVRVRSRPKGLPIAMAGSPTCTPLRGAEGQRRELEARRVDLQQREVGGLVLAQHLGLDALLVLRTGR